MADDTSRSVLATNYCGDEPNVARYKAEYRSEPLLLVAVWTLKRDARQSVYTMRMTANARMLEHRAAVLVPLGGVAVALSPSGHSIPNLVAWTNLAKRLVRWAERNALALKTDLTNLKQVFMII